MATEIYSLLEELSKEEELLSRKVDTLLSNAGNLSRSLQKLDLLRAQSQSLQVSSSYLLSTLETTSSTAERISFNVRGLDAEQSRVKETLKYVEEVKELKACVLGVHQSMEAQDWEVAAEFVHRASLVPEQIARGGFAALMVPTAETPLNPAETIRIASEQLYNLFLREFGAAAASRDTRQITRFFKLFPQIDKVDEGLDLYAAFVSSFIAEKAELGLSTASTSPILYASLVTGLFENIAKLITNHSPLITRFYGKNIDRILEKIQLECDKQGIHILTIMAEDRQIGKKVSEIRSYSFSFLVQSFLPSANDTSQAPVEREVDSKTLDALLSEIAIIFSRWSLYSSFMRHCTTEQEAPFLKDNAMCLYLDTHLESNYETMEAYFMRRSVERAFQLETVEETEHGHQVSSIVDDVMFILRKVTLRALSTGQRKTMSAIFAVVRRIMEQDYAGVLGKRMQDLQAKISASKSGVVVRSAEAERRDRTGYCTLLNNLDVSAEYVSKIVAEQQASPSLDAYGDRDGTLRIVEVLGTLNDRFARGLEDGINVLYNVFVKNRIRTTVNDTFAGAEYVLTQAGFEEVATSPAFRLRFVSAWDALVVDPFAAAAAAAAGGNGGKGTTTTTTTTTLTPTAYGLLLRVTVRAFIRVLEKKLLTLQCNELGAIKLDKDISVIIHTVAADHAGIRERFDRVREMSNVVNWSPDDGPERDEDREADISQGEEIIRSLGLQKVGVEEVEMIRREMVVMT